jgi:DNA-binding LytR/AlgR family response regulator
MPKREISKYVVSKGYISSLITMIIIFSIVVLLFYDKYSVAIWFSTEDTLRFSITMLFYIAAIVILIISRVTMNALQDRMEMTITKYGWWLVSECLAIAILYTIITITLFPVDGISTPMIGIRALLCVAVMLTIPNFIISFYAAYRSKCEELEATQYQLQKIREENVRLMAINESDTRHKEQITKKSSDRPRMVNLRDNSGTLRLTINIDSLYYLESEDNYIKIYYKHNDKIASYLLRCKTKLVEQMLQGTGMVRCHRSYIVNIAKIKFVGESHRMHFITMDDDTIKQIPVSKSYYTALLESLNAECGNMDKNQEELQVSATAQ